MADTTQPEQDPRLEGHGTDYDPERGGWYPPEPADD